MSRSLKPQLVETYKHGRLGISVNLTLDRNTYQFTAYFAGKNYSAPSLDVLRTLIHCEVEKASTLEWKPVIDVERLIPFAVTDVLRSAPFVGFGLERFWIAKKKDDGWIRYNHYNWDEPDHKREEKEWIGMSVTFAGRQFELYKNGQNHRGDRSYVIEYTPELWANLNMISGRIEELRDRLDDLMTTREGVDRLKSMAFTSLMLGAGE